MELQTAKKLVVQAGLELVKSGLIARTWGNVSCRIDEKTFVITPSGRPYETLTTEEIVQCRMEDLSYEGEIKPSSEKGAHALIYKTYPNINFVIHTHQVMASAISASGMRAMPSEEFPLLEDVVPISEYGLPGTKKLIQGVSQSCMEYKGHAIILAHHGALCFGKDYEEAFATAAQLEEACLSYLLKTCAKLSNNKDLGKDKLYNYYIIQETEKVHPKQTLPGKLHQSFRTAQGFVLVTDKETPYHFTDEMPKEAKYHAQIYQKREDINYISQDTENGLFAISLAQRDLRPLLDDFAQIVGSSSRCAKGSSPEEVEKALRGRLGVLIPGAGALCCAGTESDLHAVRLVMEKDAFAQIGTELFGGGKSLSAFDCKLMHLVYTMSYAKKAKKAAKKAE